MKLLAHFCNAALKENRVPVDVLVDLIRSYISGVNSRQLPKSEDSLYEREAPASREPTPK